MLDLAVYGTPKECIERIEAMVKKGATTISIGGLLG
jgi:alkanesulfonate monooxygenase SsuD/methylene tetrahydromethanopterin reductase-like flavin-dependent oxidoreductase (luciferase family)